MATGDQNDILSRLKSYLPRGWFGDFSATPLINGVLTGIASTFAISYSLIMFMWAQTRLQTSSGGWADIWVADFLGTSLPRNIGESDAAYIARAQVALFQSRSTRPAMIAVLTNLTGRAPVIFEPARPLDSGCLGINNGGFFGVARFGSIACPYSALITVYRPKISGGLAGSAYFDAPAWSALHTGVSHGYFGSLVNEAQIASDAVIYSAINTTRPLSTNIGVALSN